MNSEMTGSTARAATGINARAETSTPHRTVFTVARAAEANQDPIVVGCVTFMVDGNAARIAPPSPSG